MTTARQHNKLTLLFHGSKINKFSFNALAGALEIQPFRDQIELFFSAESAELRRHLSALAPSIPTVAAFSFFTAQQWEIAPLIREVKEARPDCICLAGGAHPTGDPRGTIGMGFDAVIRGEGEVVFPEIIRKILQKENYLTASGLAYLDSTGAYQSNKRAAPVSLDDFPPFSFRESRFGPIEISRGCPFSCRYCQNPHLHGATMRHRSVAAICHQVDRLQARGLIHMRFITPNAFSYGSADGRTVNFKAIEELLSGVRKALPPQGKIFFGSFPSEVRPEHVTSDTIALLSAYTDNTNLMLGCQSGSPRILEKCRRGHTIDDVYNAVRLAGEAGLTANVDFIFGLPGESEEDQDLTIAAMKKIAGMGARIHAHTFMPLPQTAFAKEPPGRISPAVNEAIKGLIARGHAFGDWQQQEMTAQKIAAGAI